MKVGDEVSAGDSIAEVETDKATMDWESQEDGYIAAILGEEGAKDIPVGTPMAVMVDDKVADPAHAGVASLGLDVRPHVRLPRCVESRRNCKWDSLQLHGQHPLMLITE